MVLGTIIVLEWNILSKSEKERDREESDVDILLSQRPRGRPAFLVSLFFVLCLILILSYCHLDLMSFHQIMPAVIFVWPIMSLINCQVAAMFNSPRSKVQLPFRWQSLTMES